MSVQTIDRDQVKRMLDRGGTANVYLAHDPRVGLGMAWSQTGERIFSGRGDGTAPLWNVEVEGGD